MEKRRTALQLGAAALGLALAGGAGACVPPLKGTQLESPRFVLTFRVGEVFVGKHFSIEISSCSKNGDPAPEDLKVDAQMPEHRHGMNYRPTIAVTGKGRYRAEGLLFHMPGRWQLVFDVERDGRTERLATDLLLE